MLTGPRSSSFRERFLIKCKVVGNIQVEVSVAVVVAEYAIRAPPGISETGRLGDIDERSFTVISVEDIRLDVPKSIVVVIGYTDSLPPPLGV